MFDLSDVTYSKWDMKRNIRIPEEPSELLAEEIAIHLGDGYIFYDSTDRSYRYGIGLNPHTESEYAEYVATLFKRLYNYRPKVRSSRLEVMSLAIGTFKEKVLQFPLGRRSGNEGLPLVQWVKSDENYAIAFIRGLIDTEGSIKKLSRTMGVVVKMRNSYTIQFLKECLELLGYEPRIYSWKEKNRPIYGLYLTGVKNIRRLIREVTLRNKNKVLHFQSLNQAFG